MNLTLPLFVLTDVKMTANVNIPFDYLCCYVKIHLHFISIENSDFFIAFCVPPPPPTKSSLRLRFFTPINGSFAMAFCHGIQ